MSLFSNIILIVLTLTMLLSCMVFGVISVLYVFPILFKRLKDGFKGKFEKIDKSIFGNIPKFLWVLYLAGFITISMDMFYNNDMLINICKKYLIH